SANRITSSLPPRLGLASVPGGRRGSRSNRWRQGRAGGAMEAVLAQVAQLPALLAVSRSALVRDWDPATLGRALQWARYFQHLHDRCRGRPRLRDALGRRLRQGPRRLALLARRKAACRLLAPRRGSPGELEPPVGAEAGMLLCRLRDEGREAGERSRWLRGVLEQLPRPRAFEVVAAALLLLLRGGGGGGDSPGGDQASGAGDGCVAGPLLSWLLENLDRFSAFCVLLPGSLLASLAAHYSQLSRQYLDLLTGWGSHLLYDPLQGRWVKSCPDEAELSWEELRERFSCLCKGPVLLRGQTRAALKLLKARDGDFKVRGLSVWTDLLLEVEEDLRKE
ncbi:FANCF protein, partial [Anseranas semipalmata]|nr:FANCF protein [Anseranas semipalmata]